MPYGSGRRLGETVRPELGTYDYSGVAQAGQALGQGFESLGQGLALRNQNKKQVEKSIKLAKDIGELIPELKPRTDEALQAMIDPDKSLREQLAIAEGIKDTLQLGLMKQDQDFKREELALRRAAIAARGAGRQESSTIVDPATHEWLLQQAAAGKARYSSVPIGDGNFKISPVTWTAQDAVQEQWVDDPMAASELGVPGAQRNAVTNELRTIGKAASEQTDAAERDAMRWQQVQDARFGTEEDKRKALALVNGMRAKDLLGSQWGMDELQDYWAKLPQPEPMKPIFEKMSSSKPQEPANLPPLRERLKQPFE